MIYQVIAVFFFSDPDEAADFFHDCETALPKSIVVNPGQPDQQCSTADLIHCRHDQQPIEPCSLEQHIDNCPNNP